MPRPMEETSSPLTETEALVTLCTMHFMFKRTFFCRDSKSEADDEVDSRCERSDSTCRSVTGKHQLLPAKIHVMSHDTHP